MHKMFPNGRKFLVIERKSFDFIYEVRRSDGLRICENGKGYRFRFLWKRGRSIGCSTPLRIFTERRGEPYGQNIAWEEITNCGYLSIATSEECTWFWEEGK